MSIIDQVARAIREHNSDGACREPECLAQDLADTGLLMTGLPVPKKIDQRVYRWDSTHTRLANDISSGAATEVEAPGGVTAFTDSEGDTEIWVDTDSGEQLLTQNEARALGLALLAAANYAEGESNA